MLYQRSKLKQTAAASNGVPSENLTPCLRANVQVLPSLLWSHFSASAGSRSAVPGLFWIRVSRNWRVTRKVSPASLEIGSKIFGLPAAETILAPSAPPPAFWSRFGWAQALRGTGSATANRVGAT